MYVRTYVRTYICMYLYVCVCMCVRARAYMWVYITIRVFLWPRHGASSGYGWKKRLPHMQCSSRDNRQWMVLQLPHHKMQLLRNVTQDIGIGGPL